MLPIEIKELRREDHARAIRFAIAGMHFDWYLDSGFLLGLYGRYFWYLELARATQVLAAYVDGRFAGVLLAEMAGEKQTHRSFWRSLYVRAFDFLQNTFYKGGAGLYERTCQAMREEYGRACSPDGEIIFLAADPGAKTKGVGSALLAELERREKGKTVFLFTDNACTYQFYEHRGFDRACRRDIVLPMGKKQVPLQCFLYSKTIG